jgi:formate dehydrogenase maturation protein FdhE
MEENLKCPICKQKEFIDILRGYENKPTHYLKCVNCFKEFEYGEISCTDESCSVK